MTSAYTRAESLPGAINNYDESPIPMQNLVQLPSKLMTSAWTHGAVKNYDEANTHE